MSVFQRGKKQVWCYRFTLNGVSYFETLENCNNEEEARAYELIAKKEIENNKEEKEKQEKAKKIKNFDKFTLEYGIEKYLEYSRAKKSYPKHDEYTVEYYRNFWGNDFLIRDITENEINRFINAHREYSLRRVKKIKNPDYKKVPGVRKQYIKVEYYEKRVRKNATINRFLESLSKLINLCKKEDKHNILPPNPLIEDDFEYLVEDNYHVRSLANDEEERIAQALQDPHFKEDVPYLSLIVALDLMTGLRATELLSLKYSDINFDSQYIEVLKTKSGKKRKVDISTGVIEMILRWKKACRYNSEYLFYNPKTKTHIKSVKKTFGTLLKKAGVSSFRFHDMRHTAATRWSEMGYEVRLIQELLGHSSPKVTERYTHVNKNRKQELANATFNNLKIKF